MSGFFAIFVTFWDKLFCNLVTLCYIFTQKRKTINRNEGGAMPGFDDFVEIFKGGKQVDSAGVEHDGDAMIDAAVAKFNAAEHEPPIVIGHPASNAPAFGWISDLKAEVVDGVKRLFAKGKQVAPDFAAMVESGAFKKRSAAFYADGSLRHVGFLGAMPPAVKGLADIAFNEGDHTAFDTEIDPQQDNAKGGKTMKFSEQELADAVAKAKEEERAALAAEFAEKERALKASVRKTEVDTLVAALVKSGAILPATVDKGLAAFMEALPDTNFEFGEGDGKKAVSPYKWFTEFLADIPKKVEFGEFAKKGKGEGQKTVTRAEYEKMTVAQKRENAANVID